MKTYTVQIGFIGLTGPYTSEVIVRAKNEASAVKKARQTIGNRDYTDVLAVKCEAPGKPTLFKSGIGWVSIPDDARGAQ